MDTELTRKRQIHDQCCVGKAKKNSASGGVKCYIQRKPEPVHLNSMNMAEVQTLASST